MKYVLDGDKHRESMFYFVKNLEIVNFEKVVVSGIDKSIWKLADDFALSKIVESINSSGISQNLMIDFSLKFIPVFKHHFIRDDNFIKSSKVIPTANCHLNCLNNLFNKIKIFHDYLNPIIVKYFDFDFNNKIIHPKINQLIKSDKDENILEMLDIINNKIANIPLKDQILVAEHVLSFVPKNDNSQFHNQHLLFNYYQKLFKSNLEKIIIDDKLFSLKHWEPSNYIIYLEICKAIENLKTLDAFQSKYSLNEVEAFDILNFLYKESFLVDNNQHPIVPNRYGEFRLKNNLTTNPGIDNEFYSLFTSLKSDVKIVQSIAHFMVKIDDLKIFNIQKFFQELSDAMDKVLKDENRDENKAEMINKFLRFDVNKFSNRSTKGIENKMDLLINTHISFIHNRIREITSPSIFDYKRWPFELIQNAVDCFQNENEQQIINNGTIMFDFNDNNVTFTHNGYPFSNNNLISLLYQYGGGKEGTKSIGRFGTGFLSTLILARTVHVSGDLYDNDTQGISGFEVTIDRNGENREELKKGIKRMEDSKKMNLPVKGKTEFIFDLPSDFKEKSNGKAYEKGIESLKSNIPQSMIFNPLIKSIILKTKDETLTYSRINNQDEHIKTIEIKSSKNRTFLRSFIYFETNTFFNYQFISKKEISKNIQINCIIEVGENKNIVCNEEFLYLSFPLFGDKPFSSPIIINSKDFEPQKERNDIIIQLDENRKDSYETAVNKFIINKSFDAFRKIIEIAINRKYTDLYNFLSGIKENSKDKFFQDNFVEKMRKMILEYPIFEAQMKNEYKKFDEIYLPIIEYEYDEFLNKNDKENEGKKEQIYKEFYYLCSQIQLTKNNKFLRNKENIPLMKYEHCLKLTKLMESLWIYNNSKLTISNFLKIISQYENINKLEYFGKKTKISFIREVIQFINKSNDAKKYQNIAFLINKKGDFTLYDSIYYFDLSNEMINFLNDIDYDYTKSIIHDEIKDLCSCYNIKSFNTKKAINTIKDCINNNNCIRLMKYITRNDTRNQMHKFTLKYLDENLQKIFIDIPHNFNQDFEEMFKRADNIVIDKLIEKIQKIDIKSNITYIHDFAKLLQKIKTTFDFNKINIIPNQLYQLKTIDYLKKDGINDENVKEVIKNIINLDLREILLEDSFSDFYKYEYNFSNLSSSVSKFLEEQNILNDDDVIEISVIVIKYSAKSDDKSIKEIADLINFFYNKSIEVNKNDKKHFTNDLVRKIMNMAIKAIINKIISYSYINEIDLPQEDLFKQLPNLYYYITLFNCSDKFDIYPNNSGKFIGFDKIQIIYDYQFDTNVLYQLIDYLNKFGSIINKDSLLHQSIHIRDDLAQKIPQKIINIKSLVDKLLKIPIYEYYINENPKTIEEKNHKTIAENFIKFIKNDKKLQIEFSDLIAKIDKTIPPEILEKQDHFSELVQIQRLLNEFEEQIQLGTIMNQYTSSDIHFIKAIIFDKINKFKGFNKTKCVSISNSQSGKSFIYNKTKYFIDKNDYEYDFSAEDSNKHTFYFVVKMENAFQFNQKEAIFQLRMMSSNVNYFIIIIVNDSYDITIQWKGKM